MKRASAIPAALLSAVLAASGAAAQTIGPVDPGAALEVGPRKSTVVNGTSGVPVADSPGASQGYLVPDAKGGYVNYAPGPPPAAPPASRADAEEVRLYARELASQITRGISGDMPLTGVVSVPSAFVDQDTRLVTDFGRLMGEQMIYELNSRGFPVQEARGATAKAPSKGGKGRAPAQPMAVLAGSYHADKDNLFVNARLVEPSGRVLRTGSALMPMTPTLRRLLGLPEPLPANGLRPTPPTIIGARDVNDPPGSGVKTPTPYSPQVKKKPAPRKTAQAKPKQPCPPGCEPIDTNKKSAAAQPSGPQAAAPPEK